VGLVLQISSVRLTASYFSFPRLRRYKSLGASVSADSAYLLSCLRAKSTGASGPIRCPIFTPLAAPRPHFPQTPPSRSGNQSVSRSGVWPTARVLLSQGLHQILHGWPPLGPRAKVLLPPPLLCGRRGGNSGCLATAMLCRIIARGTGLCYI